MRSSAHFIRLFLCFCVLAACDAYPRDMAGTTERVRTEGHLRVGVIENPPFVTRAAANNPAGSEARLITRFAQELKAQPHWHFLTEYEAFEKLHARELDLVIGGLHKDTPRADKAGLTRPYLTVKHPQKIEYVMAVMPGENRFLMTLEKFLRHHAGENP